MRKDMNQYCVTVIIPAYNVEKYIMRTLESVLAQTLLGIEIIVINDGSIDGTKEIIDAYEKKYPGQIKGIHTNNRGVTNARLEGVKMAKGKYIGFVDGDDEIEPDMYEMLFRNAIKYKADISHCGYQMIFPDGRIHYFYNTNRIIVQDHKRGLKDLLDGSLVEPGLCNKLYHKPLFEDMLRNDLMDCNIKINEDLLMNFFLFKTAKRAVFEDKCKYHYIVRNDSASRQKLNDYKIFDPIRVKDIIVKESEADIIRDAKKSYIKTCISTYNILVLEEQFDSKNRIRVLLAEAKEDVALLEYKYQIILFMIIYIPLVYEKIYRLYEKYLMKRKYE